MFRSVALSAGATALLLVTPAFAHHPSGAGSTGGAGPIITAPATTLEKGQSVAGIVLEVINLDPLSLDQLGGHPHPHSLESIVATSLVFAYGVTDNLTLSLRLPFVRRTDILDAHEGPLGDAAGVGDLSVLGQYRFYNDRASQTEAALLLGATLPTGDTSVTTPAGGLFEAEFQPGSGAWSGLLGAAFTKRYGAWSFDTNVLYQFTGDGTQDTNLGDRFLYNAAISYRITDFASPSGRMHAGLPEPMYHGGPKTKGHHHHDHDEPRSPSGPALDLVLELNGEWHDRQKGEEGFHSGGNTIYLSPGVRLSMDRWSAFVSVGVPIVNDLNGIQPESEWRLLTGVSVNF
jgi:outer membrane putative beta-barrel porin/alpha-amylase